VTAAFVGRLALGFALAVALYGVTASVLAHRRRDAVLLESARTTAYSLVGLVGVAFATLVVAIVGNDFSLAYVAENSSRETPTFFKVLAVWSADDGSLLLWALVLTSFAAAVAFRFRRSRPPGFPFVLAVLYAVASFYLVLVLGPASPFSTLTNAPIDGNGPLPLLQNHPLMAIHPPMLYIGFIGFTVPFAFAVGALLSPGAESTWIALTRRWATVAWACLTTGLILGALWAYGVLGWGGYWAWDPVENAALLPWLTGAALVHTLRLRERRGAAPIWALTLSVLTFALTTFGTFLTRGTILVSVHAFAASIVGPLYLGLLAVVLLGGFGLIAVRTAGRRGSRPSEHVLSRETSLLANNVLMLVLAFVVLLGTVLPLLDEALTNRRISVGAPYFDRNVAPLALLTLLALAIGPLIAWRHDTLVALLDRLRWAFAGAAAVAAAMALAGVHDVAAIAAIAVAAFALIASVTAASAVGRRQGRRRVGGLVAHVGFAVLVVGVVTSTAFRSQSQLTLARGQTTVWQGYEVRFDGVTDVRQPQRRVVTASIDLLRDGRVVQRLIPSFNVYPSTADPVGTPSIRVGTPANGLTDIYAALISADGSGRSITFRLAVVPGVMLVWVGGAIVVAGALIAAMGTRRRPRPVTAELRPYVVRTEVPA
jgi:cytochrome c-type biogenesis protein CcmF